MHFISWLQILFIFRSLRSLGLEEEVSSCEEEEGIGALASSSRIRSSSRGMMSSFA